METFCYEDGLFLLYRFYFTERWYTIVIGFLTAYTDVCVASRILHDYYYAGLCFLSHTDGEKMEVVNRGANSMRNHFISYGNHDTRNMCFM